MSAKVIQSLHMARRELEKFSRIAGCGYTEQVRRWARGRVTFYEARVRELEEEAKS